MSHHTQPSGSPLSDAEKEPSHLALVVDIWKYSVGVQMHFNDMGMKIRNLYFTILAAAIGLLGVVQGKQIEIPFPPVTVHLPLFVLMAVIPISMLFYFLDAHWYHRLLLGAVKQCATIEARYAGVLPEIQLGAAISRESPVKFEGIWRKIFWFIKDKRFRNKATSNIHSDAKLEVLYKTVIWLMVILIVPYIALSAVQYDGRSLAGMLFDP
jgi:hypothetical protein